MSSSSIHADPPPPIVTEPSGINYATGPALGKGGFAICHRAERFEDCKPTGQIVALKIVKTKMEPAKLAQKFVTELQIHSKLSHPNVVTFYRAFAFQTSTYVVLELCSNGSLADMLKKRKFLTLPEIRRLVIQVCGAVKYLHCRHIVHRDLKTGNLFLDSNMNVKVGDFGLAALLVTEKEMEVRRRTTMCGTPNYLAPEILEKGKGHDEKVDLWAIGVIAYTLAVGKAPFHATTKEEIYKKLRSGTYTWPELSATTNQSSDLRDLVSSLLVPEEQRPLPDQIVSHSFFRIAYVPSHIPDNARTRAPEWPAATVPSPDIVRRGYSDTWHALCKESGVGEVSPGNCFPLNKGRRIRSVVHDIAREEQLGRTPTMPIPKDVVYTSSVNDIDGKPTALQSSVRGLKEIAHNEVASSRPRLQTEKTAKDADMMPPPRAPTRAARTGSIRKAARTISEEAAKSSETVKIASDALSGPSSSTTLKVGRVRPTPVASNSAPAVTTALKETNKSSTTSSTSYQTAKSYQDPDDKEELVGTTKRSADASLARRPRGTTRPVKERAVSPMETLSVQPVAEPVVRTARERTKLSNNHPGPLSTLDELKEALPLPSRQRKKVTTPEVIEIHSDPESSSGKDDLPATGTLRLPRPPKMNRRLPQPQRRHVSEEVDPSLPGTDPSNVIANLAIFRDNLASALSKSSLAAKTASSTHRHTSTDSLPFVSRWVDYSRKHGVGYVLSDGTVGCIINATSKPNAPATPVTHVLVRNGQRWLSKIGKDKGFSGIEQVPLEIFEDHGDAGVRRKVYKGLGSVKEGPLAVEAERRRVLSVLWVKFGRYMCQSLDDSGKREEESRPGEGEGNFVRFYQRIGNVGVWGFVDGCLQVHFPDHTKLVLSPSGLAVSATVLSTEAAAHLSTHGELLPAHVNSRTVLADDVHALLFEGGRLRQRIVRANQMAEKLAFVKNIVGQWVGNGGLGRLDEDHSEGRKITWEGMATKDARKVDRVCVGRYGGDMAASGMVT